MNQGLIKNGFSPVNYNICHIACKFAEIKNKMDKRTGKVTKLFTKYIKSRDAASYKMIKSKPIVAEKILISSNHLEDLQSEI